MSRSWKAEQHVEQQVGVFLSVRVRVIKKLLILLQQLCFQIRGRIVVSISACHAEDPGSIPGRGVSCEREDPRCT